MKAKAIYAAAVVTAAVLTACSDSAGHRSPTGPSAPAPGGALRVEAEADLTAAGTRDVPPGPPEGVPPVAAGTLTFDDITSASTAPIRNWYGGGLRWTHFGVVDPIAYGDSVTGPCISQTGYFSNGYVNGTVSSRYVAYSPGGGPAEVAAKGGTFDFISAYFTAANDKNMQVYGYNNGTLLYTRTLALNCDGPTLLEANFLGVDRVVFDSSGGSAGYSPLGDTFAMDDFTYKKNFPATSEP